jgi:hypothetical protein
MGCSDESAPWVDLPMECSVEWRGSVDSAQKVDSSTESD